MAQPLTISGSAVVQIGDNHTHFHERPGTPPQPFASIPFCRDPDFVDRGDLLDQIRRICSQPPYRAALVGLGGVGKSQLAIEHAHRMREGQDSLWVFWVHAGTYTRVQEGLRTIADAVKLAGRNQPKADIAQLVYTWLANERNGRWVMVLDSADDPDVLFGATEGQAETRPLATYLPQCENGSMIITTRNKHLADRMTGSRSNSIEVGPMAETEALALLQKKLGSYLHWDTEIARSLTKALDLIPLAIGQAAAYIQARTPRSSLEKYLGEFRKSERKKSSLLEHDAGDLRRDGGSSNAVLTTWRISFDHIRSKRPSAADLLAFMSFFDQQGIPESVLKAGKPTKDAAQASNQETGAGDAGSDAVAGDDGESDDNSNDNSDSESDLDTRSAFEDDIAMLRDYCLVTVNKEGDAFEMHRLVQLSTRKWLAVFGQYDTFKKQYIERMAAAFPIGQYENWPTCLRLFAHVQAALEYRPSKDGQEEWATLLYNGGWYAMSQGRYGVAEKMAGMSRKTREKRLGKDDLDTLASILLFAEVVRYRGRWDEAEALQVQVMETNKAKFGAGHLNTLTSMASLAWTYWTQGRLIEAEKLEVQVMETRRTKLGADHPDTFSSMCNLASIYSNQGRWDEAETLFIQVVGITEAKLGADHPDTFTSMGNLASIYSQQGRWTEAETLEIQVMEMSKAKLGADHPETLTSMGNLAMTLSSQGRLAEAETLQIQVVEMTKAKLGADHPNTLISMTNLASMLSDQGRLAEAETLEMWVMERKKAKLGADYLDTFTSMCNLALIYSKQGRWDEAETLSIQVVEIAEAKLGVDHPSTLTSIGNLALIYSQQGRWTEAETLQIQVMEKTKAKLGADHPDTLLSMANLAFTWRSLGRHADALALMQSCAQARQRVLGQNHPKTMFSMAILVKWSPL